MATFSPEAWKYKQDWKDLRRKPLGEILQMKFHAPSPYDKELAEIELRRRTFVRDVIFDRIFSRRRHRNNRKAIPKDRAVGLPHYEVADRLFDSLSVYLIYFHAAQFCCQL